MRRFVLPIARHRIHEVLAVLVQGFLAAILLCVSPARAQVSAAILGGVTDPTGATVSGATVTAKHLETGETRSTVTGYAGRYWIPSLGVGEYEVHVAKQGFQEQVRGGIHLVLGQEASVDVVLKLGAITQQFKVEGDAPVISVTAADISGLVAEEQVKDLPLNGRSYDELMTLNPGVVNFTWEKTGGIGISNSTTGNMFSVAGNRPQQNLFLLNGVEFTGAAENNMQPGGASQQLLGVDAVREFNLLADTYGAEYGKHPGGQVAILTQSGTNQWHGTLFEYLRNNALDAPNFFDLNGAPPFQRNQFGASMGGPIQKEKTFVFANFEGFRQNLQETSLTFVPDNNARSGALVPLGSGCPAAQQAACASLVTSLLNLWPAPNGPNGTDNTAAGLGQYFSSPPQKIREDFGTTRIDHVFSGKDSAMAAYTADDSGSVTATPFDAFSTDLLNLREQVFSIEETHVFSPTTVNTARFGFSRAGYFYTGELTPGSPAANANITSFVGTFPPGAVVVGGSQASNPQSQLGLAGSNNGSNLHISRNLFTYVDQIAITQGRHQITGGIWLQRLQSNELLALSQFGQLTFTGVPAFLQGIGSFLYDPSPTPLGWRSLYGAWFVEDVIRFRPNLTFSLGYRQEFSTGWNEANARASNYPVASGVVSSPPIVTRALFSKNRAQILPEPRIGLAWSPLGPKTVIRAGFGMYHDLQDSLGYRADQNAPFNPTYTVAAGPIAGGTLNLPVNPSAANPVGTIAPGGVQPDMYTPTVIEYSLRIERELSPNTSLSVGYVGSHGYHELIGVDLNSPQPVVCPASPCPTNFPATTYVDPISGNSLPVWGALAGRPVPAGTFYVKPGTAKPNKSLANTWTWMSEGTSSYNALVVDLKRRFSKGLTLRGVYTWSKALDDGDSLNATAAGNAPGLVSNPYDIRADWGPATYDVRNLGVITASYELPFGQGRRYFGSALGGSNLIVGGWTLNSIVTLQSGFPFTPQLAYNPSSNGDTRNPVRPFLNPAFSGPVVLGTPGEWFNPNAFVAPQNNSGFFGNVGRDTYTGPGLGTWDFSVLKETHLFERLNLQFRAEIFNMLNRANFNTPNLITAVLLPSVTLNTSPTPTTSTTVGTLSPATGTVTSTSTAARQVQFGLKLLW
ncbi:MAG TPA: carboxypeptidase-like regulatory domain-containing protein [Candidatus Acidoferrales bacterium]|nr:carboxypeptidase-like regulatory domain-containing protein [Candidatus Acidoferrales bacterium]